MDTILWYLKFIWIQVSVSTNKVLGVWPHPFICCHLFGVILKFSTTVAKLSSRDRDEMVGKAENIYFLACWRKSLPTPTQSHRWKTVLTEWRLFFFGPSYEGRQQCPLKGTLQSVISKREKLFAQAFPRSCNLCPGRELLKMWQPDVQNLTLVRTLELEALLRKYASLCNATEISRSAWMVSLGEGRSHLFPAPKHKTTTLSPLHSPRLLPVYTLISFPIRTLPQLNLQLQARSLSEPICLRKCL